MNEKQPDHLMLAVLAPGANTVVQPEYEAMRPDSVTNNVVRIPMDPPKPWKTDADYAALLAGLDPGLEAAADAALLTAPDAMVLGISIESIWDEGNLTRPKLEAAENVRARIEGRGDGSVKVTQCTDALPAALRAFGVTGPVAIIDPYFPVTEEHIRMFMEEIGWPARRIQHIGTATPRGIADIDRPAIYDAIRAVDGPDIGAIVQFGANMKTMRAAAVAQDWLQKPVISINVVTYWHALRVNGIKDRVLGCGDLLELH